ncbi:hypothetical protein TNCV_3693201 [Trichonephila clavipes]|nr:hypothetical protein TNCV_3693201 [Trichonephila clavipes]
MAPHKPRKSASVEYTTDEEDMIIYEMEEEEFEKNLRINSFFRNFFEKILANMVNSADKGWRVYQLDPHTDAVPLYSGCTLGQRCAWFLPDDRHTVSLVGLRGGWRHAIKNISFHAYGSYAAVPGYSHTLIPQNIELQMPPRKPKKSEPLQDTSNEDMLLYDVEEEIEEVKKDTRRCG